MSQALAQPKNATNTYNILDVFLILSISASFNRTRAALRKTGWFLFNNRDCDEEAKEAIRELVINAQDPLMEIDKALKRYQGNPHDIADFEKMVAEGTLVQQPLCG